MTEDNRKKLVDAISAYWWETAEENNTVPKRGPEDMPGGWKELFDELAEDAIIAIRNSGISPLN